MKVLRNPVSWGAGAIVFATVVSLVLAGLYIKPPWERTVSFYTDDAVSVRAGDQVRMAGITVGRVESLSLEANRVLVTARVEKNAFVGDQSQVQVRMLTVVGGYYVDVISMGRKPLGDMPIPVTRVTMPYSLIQTLTDATKITDNVNPTPINHSLNQIQKGLTGDNVDSLSAMVDAGNAVMSIMDRQRGQLTSILDMSNEYIASLNDYREQIKQLLLKLSIITQTLVLYNKEFGTALEGFGDVVEGLKPVADFYEGHRIEFLEKVRQYQERTRLFVERNGLTVRFLHRLQNVLGRILDAQNATPELLATDLCIPLPGSPC
ncbi:MlaD family protein [Mycobacterium sp. NPDC003449]